MVSVQNVADAVALTTQATTNRSAPSEAPSTTRADPVDECVTQVQLSAVKADAGDLHLQSASPVAPVHGPAPTIAPHPSPEAKNLTSILNKAQAVPSLDKGITTKTATSSSTKVDTPIRGFRRLFQVQSFLASVWAWEIANCCLSNLCLIVLVILLVTYRGQPVSNWSLYISINSLIAVFSAIMKASLMMGVSEGISQMKWLWYFKEYRSLSHFEDFDTASRGPWGAVMLLSRRRPHHIANLGAFITVLMVAIDPFFQQLIQYYDCLHPIAAPATVSRTNNYTSGGYQTQMLFAEPDNAMANALYSGALEPPSTEAAVVAYNCPTGNCTFSGSVGSVGAFSSLAMCSSCDELSHRIEKNESFPSYYISPWWSEPILQVGEIYKWNNLPFQLLEASKVPANNSNFDEVINLQFLMLVLDNPASCDLSNTTHCTKHPWAVGCSLYPCVKTYSASVQGSVLSETIVSTVPLRKTNTSSVEVTVSPDMTWSLATDQLISGGRSRECSRSDTLGVNTSVAISVNRTLQIGQDPNDSKTTWYEPDCVWTLGTTPGLAINQLLSHMFDASLLGSVTEDTVSVQGDTWMKRFYRNGTVDITTATQFFEGLANTLTGLIRQHGDTVPSGYALGTQLAMETCFHVQWPWLIYPAALNFMTVIFLVATLKISAKTRTLKGAWRSTSLAAMFQRVERKDNLNHHGDGGLFMTRNEFEEAAKAIDVKIVDGILKSQNSK